MDTSYEVRIFMAKYTNLAKFEITLVDFDDKRILNLCKVGKWQK